MVRAFVALEAPDPASPGRADARAHLTLKFLGEISPDLVAPLGKLLKRRGRDAHFDGHVASACGLLGEARRFERLLNVHAVIDDVGGELRVS